MLQGYTMAIVPCGNPTPKKLPTGGGEWPTFRTARAQRVHSARTAHGAPPFPHTCTRSLASPRQGKARQGMAGMAWHGLVICACALSSMSHFVGHLPRKVS